jgi:hypothetical protein
MPLGPPVLPSSPGTTPGTPPLPAAPPLPPPPAPGGGVSPGPIIGSGSRYLIVSYYDWGQDPGASITGGGFQANAPASNMLIPRPQLTAIATAGSVSFTLDLGATRTIGLIHIQNLIVDLSATISVTAGTYTSTNVPAWANDANGLYPAIEWNALGRPRFFVPPVPVSTNTINISISGSIIPVQIGFLGACEIWQAPINLSYNSQITVEDLSDVTRVPFGSTYVVRRPVVRRLNLAVDFLRQPGIYAGVPDEIFAQPLALAVIQGKSVPSAVVPFPDDTYNLERTSVGGFFTSDGQFSNPFFATWNDTMQIDQLV